jgi:hypothetical protein
MQRQGRPGMGRARCLQDAASWSAARDTRLADRLRCPRRQMRQRSWADRLTLAPRKEVVDPLCLRWPGSACHVGHFALLGEVCPLRPSPPAIRFFSTYSRELFAGLADRNISRRPQTLGRGVKILGGMGSGDRVGGLLAKFRKYKQKAQCTKNVANLSLDRSLGGAQLCTQRWLRQRVSSDLSERKAK